MILDLTIKEREVIEHTPSLTHEELVSILDGKNEEYEEIKGLNVGFEVDIDFLDKISHVDIETEEGETDFLTYKDYFVYKVSVDGTKAILIPCKNNGGSYDTSKTDFLDVLKIYDIVGTILTKSEKEDLLRSDKYTEYDSRI